MAPTWAEVYRAEYVATYMDDTHTVCRGDQAAEGPEQGRLLTARYHGLNAETPATVDVSCAYGKAKAAVG